MDLKVKEEEGCRIFTVIHEGHVLGYVAIDSSVGGRSCGGLRLLPDIYEAEVRTLARSMTLKYGFLGLPQGGAKAGVIGNPEEPRMERLKKLVAFGQAIQSLLKTKTYIPTSDMGTENTDIRHMLHTMGIPVASRDLRNNSSGYYTALSVLAGVKQSVHHLGLNLSDCTVAIEGFGNVGKPLAALLAQKGIKIVAISTSQGALYHPQGLEVTRLIHLAEHKGSEVVKVYREAECIDRETLLELPVDILCPCARWNSIRSDNQAQISALIICPGANNPITPDAERALFERGVLCLPDFIANCGGVLGGTMEFASIPKKKIAGLIDSYIGERMAWLLNQAKAKHILPRDIAVPLALSRFKKIQDSRNNPTFLDRLFELGLTLYRHGRIPGSLVANLSPWYFKKILGPPMKIPY